jgi:DNA-directed RNA polymerase subunit RPC12/RpoP
MAMGYFVEGLRSGNPVKCSRCGKELDIVNINPEWDPHFPSDHNYKSLLCECGKKKWFKMDVPVSGHDEGIEEEKKSIESAINKVQEK